VQPALRGLDSSAVTAMAYRAIAVQQGGRIRSFSVDFANHGAAFVAGDFHKSSDTSFVRDFVAHVCCDHTRTLCCCQSVACIISSILAPSDWLRRVSTRSCLVTPSALGSSAFLSVLAAATRSAFDSTDRVGFLALAAGDVTLRRDAVFDWALPFLGAALFVFRDFMEKGRHRLGSVGSRRRN
jgi:hypothetical protein